jgi:cobyrinic acid a,c-diamide synthase
MRGIVIAGTHSGCGKTTVTLGILAALRKKGLTVQPFKAGPDFIDAGLHRLAVDRQSRNLDQWMCGPDYVIECFRKHAAGVDIAVVEGVMGMYDGDASTASLASLLDVPVLLVVDAYGMAESAGAVVHGFAEFGVRGAECRVTDKSSESEIRNAGSVIKFAGVIFNRVASENHYKRLSDSVRDVPVLGYLLRDLDFEIPHRHLGLSIAEENPLAAENIEKLADAVIRHIDIDAVLRQAEMPKGEQQYHAAGGRKGPGRFRLAVAYDKAFSFYYEDNLDLMCDAGAEIIRFSPLADRTIPDRVDAVYIGGGYPEIHADALSRNRSMLESVRAWAEAGKPLYAECGGMMYLSKGIRDFENRFFAMAGVFPFETRMTKRPRLGYREILLNDDCIIGSRGERCRGHEFHYSEIAEVRSAERGVRSEKHEGTGRIITNGSKTYVVHDGQGREKGREGFRYKNTLASYVHIHFGSNRRIAEHIARFIKGESIS